MKEKALRLNRAFRLVICYTMTTLFYNFIYCYTFVGLITQRSEVQILPRYEKKPIKKLEGFFILISWILPKVLFFRIVDKMDDL